MDDTHLFWTLAVAGGTYLIMDQIKKYRIRLELSAMTKAAVRKRDEKVHLCLNNSDSDLSDEIVNHNYEVARQFYSYSTIRIRR